MANSFWQYDLTNLGEPLCLGERVKKGTYRGTIDTCIPYSQISGALTAKFTTPYHAVGILHSSEMESFSFALQDVARGVAKLTLDVSAISKVRASVYVWNDPATQDALPNQFDVRIGALRSKGFGLCRLSNKRAVLDADQDLVFGELRTRIPETELERFAIESSAPLYGYLFEPSTDRLSGRYVRALVEASLVRGPKFLVRERSL